MTTAEADILSYNSQDRSSELSHDAFDELGVQDLLWVVNTSSRYASMLNKIPTIFAWEESKNHLANLQVLARSVALRRLRSALDHIGRYDQELGRSMRSAFEELPVEGKLRFMLAPETFYRITRLRKKPVDAITSLCNFLNGEAALHGLGPIDKGYVTAIGDFYYSEDPPQRSANTNGKGANAPANAVYAPRFAETIPIDFGSPNSANAQESDDKREYLPYSEEEKAVVREKLDAAFNRIERVSEAAAYLIKQHVKVVIPLKAAEGGYGSTSQPHFPGRVLLRGVDICPLASLATNLVHESIHQVMYILEWGGPFFIEDPDARAARVRSGWTGRDLPLHSFIHACFVWYGLSNFWTRPAASEVFQAADAEKQLSRSMAGFRNQNPADQLTPYAGMLRYDVVKTAATLRDRLQGVIDQTKISAASSA
jgi:hypothetical protein